jgi:hypothetical protein
MQTCSTYIRRRAPIAALTSLNQVLGIGLGDVGIRFAETPFAGLCRGRSA